MARRLAFEASFEGSIPSLWITNNWVGSSVAERVPVKHLRVGSSPTRPSSSWKTVCLRRLFQFDLSMAKWCNGDTRRSERRTFGWWEFESPLGY